MNILLLFSLVIGIISFKLCSFNVQVFGSKKESLLDVVDILVKIYRRYDMLFMMEIRDTTDAVHDLLNHVNEGLPQSEQYDLVLSDRLGRTASKEQYAFFYKKTYVTIHNSIQYDDPFNEKFQRPPFGIVANLTDPKSGGKMTAFFMGLHDDPGDAYDEITYYAQAYKEIEMNNTYDQSTQDAVKNFPLLFGDLNAGGKYVSHKKLKMARETWSKLGMDWLIDDDVDTMVKTDYAYDRFISKKGFEKYMDNIGVFYYDKAFGVNFTEACRVSDHYPIEMDINF